MPFEFNPLAGMPEVILVEPRVHEDERGWFMETYKAADFARHGVPTDWRQDDHVRTEGSGTVRGLHYQKPPMAQGKIVRVTIGEIFDVAVDIRRGSPSFGRYVAVLLSAKNRRAVWIPPGFAHGYCTITEACEVTYKHTAEYSPQHSRTIRWDDPALGIAWPTQKPVLSAKDAKAPLLAGADHDFVYGE